MSSELKAALERRKAECYIDYECYRAANGATLWNYSWHRAQDNAELADAYVELMARRESSRDQCEFQAPTREWFEWLKNRLIDLAHSEIKDNIKAAAAFTHAAEICVTWRDRFESFGAFDRDGMERQ